jgi:hypothetical protein
VPESSACGGGRAEVRRGASLGIPRWSRILRIASGFVIAARIFMRPWHFGHVSASVMNTRLRRRAQGSRLTLGSLLRSMSRDSPSPALSAPAASAPAASGARRGRCRHHLGAILGCGTEDAVVSDKMAARAGNQRDQLLYQLVRREHDVRGAIPPNLLEAQGKPTVGQFL